jgi:hypothetical protein
MLRVLLRKAFEWNNSQRIFGADFTGSELPFGIIRLSSKRGEKWVMRLKLYLPPKYDLLFTAPPGHFADSLVVTESTPFRPASTVRLSILRSRGLKGRHPGQGRSEGQLAKQRQRGRTPACLRRSALYRAQHRRALLLQAEAVPGRGHPVRQAGTHLPGHLDVASIRKWLRDPVP